MIKKIIFLILCLFSALAKSDEFVWKINFDGKLNIPHLNLNIDGKDIEVTLDTGGKEGLYLPLDFIDNIVDKIELSENKKSIDLSGNINITRSFIANNLVINSLIFKKVNVIEYKPWGLAISSNNEKEESDDFPAIGLGLFNQYVLTLNFPKSEIIISNDINLSLDNTWVELPFRLMDEGLVIEMSDDYKNYQMILDTGASLSMIKAQSLSPESIKIKDENSDYQFVELGVSYVSSDKVEAIILDSLPPEFQSDGLLGIDVLQSHLIKIDFKNKKLWIKPFKTESSN